MTDLTHLEVYEPEVPGTVGEYLPKGLCFINGIPESYIINLGDYVEYPLAHLSKMAVLRDYKGPTRGTLVFVASEITHKREPGGLRKIVRLRYVKEVGVRFENKPLA